MSKSTIGCFGKTHRVRYRKSIRHPKLVVAHDENDTATCFSLREYLRCQRGMIPETRARLRREHVQTNVEWNLEHWFKYMQLHATRRIGSCPPISAVDLLAASTKMVVTRCRNATRRLRTMEATTNTNSTAIAQKLNSRQHALGKSAKTYNGGKTLSLDIDSLDHWLVAGESGIVCHGLGHALSSAI